MSCIQLGFLVIIIASQINENAADCFKNEGPDKVYLKSDSSFYRACECDEPGITGKDLTWLGPDGKPIGKSGNEVSTEISGNALLLTIPKVSKSIVGMYTCVVKNAKYTTTVTIFNSEPIQFIKMPTKQHLILGKNNTIACEIIAENDVLVSWQRKNQTHDFAYIEQGLVSRYNNNTKKTYQTNLTIQNVTHSDAGIYKITVITTSETASREIEVDVHVEPTILDLSDILAVAESNLSIDCIAEGKPTPQYTWRKINANGTYKNETEKQKLNTINFNNINVDDEGIYECVAYNDVGSATKSMKIEVLVKPNITQFVDITAKEMNTVQVECKADGKPAPNITIKHEIYDLQRDAYSYQILQNTMITLDRSRKGIYICNAANEAGYDEAIMNLTVLHKPYFIEASNNTIEWGFTGKTVNLSCENESEPPANVTWRFQNDNQQTIDQVEINKELFIESDNELVIEINNTTAYGIYICSAKNTYGEDTKAFNLKKGYSPPPIDTKINITDLLATSVTFQIDGQFKDIPEVKGYTARYDVESNYDVTDIHPNRTWSIGRPFTIEGLKSNTTYFVEFAAVNDAGTGDFCCDLNFRTLEPSVPKKPEFAENPVQYTLNENFMIQWKKTNGNGEPIEYYILKYCPVYAEVDLNKCKTIKTLSAKVEVKDMDFNTTYSLEIVAHNIKGDSDAEKIIITTPVKLDKEEQSLAGGTIIAISIVLVLLCLLLLDLLLLVWKRQGVIAYFCLKDKKKKQDTLKPSDNKGLLTTELTDTRLNNKHREYEYNKNTGVVTGKHSSV